MGKIKALLLIMGLLAAACSRSTPQPSYSETKIVDESLSNADLQLKGNFKYFEYEYDSAPFFDRDVLPSGTFEQVRTDIRGRLFLPDGNGPFPLIIFLHGNHGTCGFLTGVNNPRLDVGVEFTTRGQCPEGYIEAPSYRGYDESARLLASWGYAVASINANRGITGRNGTGDFDIGLVHARGLLVLRHIEELYKWSRDGRNSLLRSNGLDIQGKIDTSRVGLMGHSRGGEGVRYAYNIATNSPDSSKWKSRIPDLQIKGIFEIAPVDMGTNSGTSKAEARGVAWNVLIPGCDRDVSDFSGVNPYERMLSNLDDGFPKSVFTVWGANHNFFNSEWQVSDAPHTCIGNQEPLWNAQAPSMPNAFAEFDSLARAELTGSAKQIAIAKSLLFAFFHSHLGEGKNQRLKHVFDPQYRLPRQLSALALTSREYFLAADSKSLFNPNVIESVTKSDGISVRTMDEHLKKQLSLMEASLDNYGSVWGSGNYSTALTPASFIRPAMVLEAEASQITREVTVPFTNNAITEDYWTLDLALAIRKSCYIYDNDFERNCPVSKIADTFKLALVLEDGTVTPEVAIEDYVKLDNWYSDFLEKSSSNVAATGTLKVSYTLVPVLYQTARFELTDFNVRGERVKAIKFIFDDNAPISLILESIRLSKRP